MIARIGSSAQNLQIALSVILVIACCRVSLAAEKSRPTKPPNFIVINIDDLGYGDIGSFGAGNNETPNLDRMAQEGRKLTSFYAAPVCSPSRASLMTGSYPKRALSIPRASFTDLKPGTKYVLGLLSSVDLKTRALQPHWRRGIQLGSGVRFIETREWSYHDDRSLI